MEPVQDGATFQDSFAAAPGGLGNRLADLLDILVSLIDSGTLTVTTGAETDGFTDAAAFTGVNSLVGATFTYAAATTTVALRGVTRTVVTNTVNKIFFDEATVANQAGDTGTLEFTNIDADIAALRGEGRGLGDSQSNPYGPGPSYVNAVLKVLEALGVTPPAWLNTASAEPFGLGSPHAGHGGTHGHAALILASNMLQEVRDAVAAYTAPA
jgi:hypothetical protein